MPDDQIATVGEMGWNGFRSRPDPLTLPDGIAAISQNMRFVRGRAEVRKGAKRLLDGVSINTAPLVVPFSLANDVAVTSITLSGSTATVTTTAAHGYTTGDYVEMRGATETEYNGDFQVTVSSATVFTYTVTGTPATPATGTPIANKGPIVRESYTGGIYGACTFSSPNSATTGNGAEYIALFGADKCFLYRYGQSVLTKTYPSGETIEQDDHISFVQAFDKLFLFRARDLTGSYARKSCTIASSSGTATVTSAAHGYSTGDRICIEGATQSAYNIEADITSTGADTFTFAVSHSPDPTATGTITCRLVKPPLMWDGGSGNFAKYGGGSSSVGATYSTLRSTGAACYQNNQLFIAKTPLKDEILISDVLDPNTFDPLQASFRCNVGSDDRIIALHPFAEGQTLIFGRKSIYRAKIVLDYATGTNIDPTSSFIELVTNEVGCRAASTIVTAGQFVYFLSDSGVYRLDTAYQDIKVRGVTLPLSDSISDQFSAIAESNSKLASAVWFDSRYWIAIPTGGSEYPNTLLVWSALTGEWESVDSFPAPISTLLVSDYADKRRLFGASRAGKLFLLEEREDGDDAADSTVATTVDIPGRLVTRRYSGGDMSRKRWLKAIASVNIPSGSSLGTSVNCYEFDKTLSLGTTTNSDSATEDYVIKRSIRANAASLEIEFNNMGPGRPVIRSAQADFAASRPSLETRTSK